jgi:hypothetical protein
MTSMLPCIGGQLKEELLRRSLVDCHRFLWCCHHFFIFSKVNVAVILVFLGVLSDTREPVSEDASDDLVFRRKQVKANIPTL